MLYAFSLLKSVYSLAYAIEWPASWKHSCNYMVKVSKRRCYHRGDSEGAHHSSYVICFLPYSLGRNFTSEVLSKNQDVLYFCPQ